MYKEWLPSPRGRKPCTQWGEVLGIAPSDNGFWYTGSGLCIIGIGSVFWLERWQACPKEEMDPPGGWLGQDRFTKVVVVGAFRAFEEEVALEMVQQSRGQAGVFWVSDGRAVYRQMILRVYCDSLCGWRWGVLG